MISVVKYGGAALAHSDASDTFFSDLASLQENGKKIVIVHGGGSELSELQKRLSIKTRFVSGLRYTDGPTMEAAVMALAGKVNKTISAGILVAGGRAAGISGVDGGMLLCEKHAGPDLGYVGQIKHVDNSLIMSLLDAGFIPVIATIGVGEDGQFYNINADTAAAKIATAIGATWLIVMTDTPGVLEKHEDADSVISKIMISEIPELIEKGIVSGGMIPKLTGLADAVRSGVKTALIADGRVPHILSKIFFGDKSQGTVIE